MTGATYYALLLAV